jgi:putative flippase GtrA
VVDLSLASALVLLFALPDAAASAAGLFAGMIFNYLVHVSWTFRGAGRKPSFGHFLQYAAAVGVTLVIRIAVLLALPPLGLAGALPPPARLFLAAVVSFAASWLICRHLIFRPAPPAGST